MFLLPFFYGYRFAVLTQRKGNVTLIITQDFIKRIRMEKIIMDNRQWFRQAKFGMMVHFGLYSIPAGEWKGKRMPYIAEWLQAYSCTVY